MSSDAVLRDDNQAHPSDEPDDDFEAFVAEQHAQRAARREVVPPEPGSAPRALAWLLVVGGLVGLAAAFQLTLDKFRLLANPNYVPSCNLNAVLSCGSVMQTKQAAAFGFPNPFLGLVAFAAVVSTGAALLAGARLAGWYWAGLQLGATLGIGFAHWLIFDSLYAIGVLCPYCVAVWAVTIPIFWYVTVRNLRAGPGGLRRAAAPLIRHHLVVLVSWYLVIAVLVGVRFWSYWRTLVQ